MFFSPRMPYMICSEPSGFRSPQRSLSQSMNRPASYVKPSRMRPYRLKLASRIQV